MATPTFTPDGGTYAAGQAIVVATATPGAASAVMAATARARAGGGPTLIECKTYRIRGHSRSDRNRYRTKEEIEEWKLRDPIGHFETELVANGIATVDEVAGIFAAADAEIAEGIEFARNGTDPTPDEVTRDVYTPGIHA